MPELPEVETIRRGLQKTILGKTIQRVEVRLSKIVSLGPDTVSNHRRVKSSAVVKFKKLLRRKKIVEIRRRAKMLLLKLSPAFPRKIRHLTPALSDIGEGERVRLWILIHLKMTGQLLYAKSGERKKRVKIINSPNSQVLPLPHRYTHVIFKFTDGSKLFYNDLRQFGYLRLVNDEDVPKVKELAEYGPEPFSKDFTFRYFLQKARRRPSLAIKQFLLDPKVVAGIGNIYSDEILYWAKARPNRKVSGIRKQELGKIYENVKKVLKAAIAAQGSSVGDFFKVDGSEGHYKDQHMVYGRRGELCWKCKTIIKSVRLGGRISSYCPKCQK